MRTKPKTDELTLRSIKIQAGTMFVYPPANYSQLGINLVAFVETISCCINTWLQYTQE